MIFQGVFCVTGSNPVFGIFGTGVTAGVGVGNGDGVGVPTGVGVGTGTGVGTTTATLHVGLDTVLESKVTAPF
jgi:hypothetical protein